MNSKYRIKDRVTMSLGMIVLAVCVLFIPHTVMEKLVGRMKEIP